MDGRRVEAGGGPAAIVQFPHPGGEHVPRDEHMPWNMGAHARKFMSSQATYIDAAGVAREGDVCFWGEWEAPSQVLHRWSPQPDLPTVLHQPYWVKPAFEGFRQNTDPWVFGDAFFYSNCKQITSAKTGTASALQRLPVGSMILFGSTRARREFVLDTVFVVGARLGTYRPVAPAVGLSDDQAFQACTLDSLRTTDEGYRSALFTLFRGATPASPVGGLYSFVPCLARGAGPARFPRPAIRLPGIVNPRSTQSPSGAKNMRSAADVAGAWHEVVRQVRAAGLDMAVRLMTPRRS